MRIPGFQGLALQGLVLASVLLAGCSTSQQVQLSKRSYHPPVTSVAQSPQDGNSPEMTAHLVDALRDAGLTVITVTHEDSVAAHAHRRVRIIDGRLTEEVA